MPTDQGDGFLEEDRDRLPWLEPAEPIEEIEPVPLQKVLALVLLGLVLLALIIGGGWWLKSQSSGGSDDGDATLIAAPAEPYKLPANQVDAEKFDTDGKKFAGEGDAVYAESDNVNSTGRIDASKAPEMAVTEVVKAKPPAPKAPPPAKPGEAKAPAPVAQPSAPTLTGAKVQIGAYNSKAIADEAWKRLGKRFEDLASARHSIEPVTVGGRTLYRLRIGAGDQSGASAICGRLRVAGETCWVVP